MVGMGHIVVGVDETPESAAALRRAAEEAFARGTPLVAVLVWDYLSQHRAAPGGRFDPHYSEADAHAALEAIVDRVLGPDPGVRIERRVVCGLPAPSLIEAANDADLLVVGCHERHGVRAAFATSVSTRCRHHRPCPMLVVHVDGRCDTVDRMPVG